MIRWCSNLSTGTAQASADSLPAYQDRILRAIRRIMRSVDLYSHKLAMESGVTVPQLSCLLRVVQAGPLTHKALASELDLSASTLVGIVDRLESKGLVKRARSSVDRRQVLISATEEGAILASGSPSPLQDRLAAALEAVSELERAAIALSLDRIVNLMEIGQVDAALILDTAASLHRDVDEAREVNLPKPETAPASDLSDG
jgi:DNA-binding MarR family transcriptional regulator